MTMYVAPKSDNREYCIYTYSTLNAICTSQTLYYDNRSDPLYIIANMCIYIISHHAGVCTRVYA